MESTTYLLRDEQGLSHAIFSGDTLSGDVGRPDLAQKSHLTIEDLAGHLFDSLRNKIMTLGMRPSSIQVMVRVCLWQKHEQGDGPGRGVKKYALGADMTKEEFVKEAPMASLLPGTSH